MKLRTILAASAVIVGCALPAIAPGTAGADVPAPTPAVQAFWHQLYELQNYPATCTAYTSNIIGDGEGGGIKVIDTPLYMGNCAQAWVLVLNNNATFYTFNG